MFKRDRCLASSWYDDAVRTIVDLTDEQLAELRRYCEAEGVSRAEAIRRGVDLLTREKVERKVRLLEALRAAAGSWKSSEDDRDIKPHPGEWEREWITTEAGSD